MNGFEVCPACDGSLVARHAGLWCDRCHVKVEGCCEGAPTPVCAVGVPADRPRTFSAGSDRR